MALMITEEPLAKLMSGDRLPHFGPFPSLNFAPWNHHEAHSIPKRVSKWECRSSTQSFARGSDECMNCDLCEQECPNSAIFEDEEIYAINPDLCTECVGHFDVPQCQKICPVDCIPRDLDVQESRGDLLLKYRHLTGQASSL